MRSIGRRRTGGWLSVSWRWGDEAERERRRREVRRESASKETGFASLSKKREKKGLTRWKGIG